MTLTPWSRPALTTALIGLDVGAGHDHDVGGARARHHLRLEVAAVHRLEVGHDGMAREGRAQRLHAAQPFGEDERRPRLQPVHSRFDGDARRVQGLVEVDEVERDLDDGGVPVGA